MAEKRNVTHIDICAAENGYTVCVCHEPKKSLSQKKGWVPTPYEEPKKYVADSKEKVLELVKKHLGDM
jgi:hypothetical protein